MEAYKVIIRKTIVGITLLAISCVIVSEVSRKFPLWEESNRISRMLSTNRVSGVNVEIVDKKFKGLRIAGKLETTVQFDKLVRLVESNAKKDVIFQILIADEKNERYHTFYVK
jgi:hypothetical protein